MKITVVSSPLDRFLCGRQVEKNALAVDYISRGVNLKADIHFYVSWRKNSSMLKEERAFCLDLSKTYLPGNFCGVQSLTFDLGNDHSSCSQDVRRVEGLVFADDGLKYTDQVRQTLLHQFREILQVLCEGRRGQTQVQSPGVETVTTLTRKNLHLEGCNCKF